MGAKMSAMSQSKTCSQPAVSFLILLCMNVQLNNPNVLSAMNTDTAYGHERQVTRSQKGHILTNIGVWSPDSEWIVYDTRSDAAGEKFDGETIEEVNWRTGEVRVLYRSKNGAHCGVVTHHPRLEKVVFILGPEHPTPDWQYGPYHRQGVMVDKARPMVAGNMDARDIVPPFTPGALRGGSHVHVFSPDGLMASFTYEDHVLAQLSEQTSGADLNQRNVGVAIAGWPVRISHVHPRNHDGEFFSVLVTRTVNNPRPGSDEISRAFEEGWIGAKGYQRADGRWQKYALAFQGHVLARDGRLVSEVFIVDLPEQLDVAGDGPLEGTTTRRPFPPRGALQRRLTFTTERKYPGLQGPRHWLRSSPDGSRIAFLMKDDDGIVQFWVVSPNGGAPRQLTRNPWPVASAFSWSPDGRWLAHVMDNSVFITDTETGRGRRLTSRTPDGTAPRPEACVFSPDGRKIAYVRRMPDGGREFNQIFVVTLD